MLTTEQVQAFHRHWRPTQEKVDLAVKTAVKVARPFRVFLFGSWARGEATIDSDLDLAVLVPDERKAEMGELHKQIRLAFSDIPMSIDLVLASEGYVAEFHDSINSVYYKILHEGKLVYDGRNQEECASTVAQSR